MEPIVGIDLGTTNSEIAYIFNDNMRVLTDQDTGIVPSCVGLDDDGKIIVGALARNQAVLAPDRTVSSIKRLMGTDQSIHMGDQSFSPQEISAFILKYLKSRAEKTLGQTVSKAVITVPAYFTDDQRQATREAGQIAGLEVVRIINEPTAAALAYESQMPDAQKILIYDLGGGTFDVSIVQIEDGVVEVLASTGDNHLGGDDFDQKISTHMVQQIKDTHQIDVSQDAAVMARLRRAAETAKIELSDQPFAAIEVDHVGRSASGPVHLSLELSRNEFEEMIEQELSRTMLSVTRALEDAELQPADIDKIILVGGSTRIPRIAKRLEEKIGHAPHGEIDPDLCVAIGAGIQAAREMGMQSAGMLVDITPYTFGTSAIGEIQGLMQPNMFVPLIRRNTKLPCKKSEVFYTMVPNQKAVKVDVYQGEAPVATDNILLGDYHFDLTPAPANSEIVLHFDLDLNGILKIKAVERSSGNEINAIIENAISRFSESQLASTRDRIDDMWADSDHDEPVDPADVTSSLPDEISGVISQARQKLDSAEEEDRDEMINLIEDLQTAIQDNKMDEANSIKQQLEDILFYLD